MLAGTAMLLIAVGTGLAKGPKGDDVHRPDASCPVCHVAEAATLRQDPAAARDLLVPDVDARCATCHGDEGPSHPTGIHVGVRPEKPVPASLPLSTSGTITCATCHFMHGESNAFGDFLRVDNHRGALCLSCHTLAELER